MEVKNKCPLLSQRLLISNWQAMSSGDGMDNDFERMCIIDGRSSTKNSGYAIC